MMTDVATCTSRCWIMPRYILDSTESKNHKDDKYLYVDITEQNMILNRNWQNVKNSPLRCSLFPYVAPYVKFCTFDAKRGSEMPGSVTKHLKFSLANQRSSNIVRKTFLRSGCSLTKKLSDCCGIWGKHCNKPPSRSSDLKRFQKVNRIPGTLQLSCKDKLWRHVNVMASKFGKEAFGFIPKTYILPEESWRLRQVWEENRGKKWIVKPPKADRGNGIRVVNEWWEIPKYRSMIVQRYLSKTRLIRGQKFDIRLYVLITSFNPLRIYLYRDGLVRFATMKYVDGGNYLIEKCMHLTNTNINRTNAAYRVPSSVDSQSGHLWSLKTLWKFLEKSDDSVDVKGIWSEMKDIVVKTLISGEPSVEKVLKAQNPSRLQALAIGGKPRSIHEQ
ncbi:tubulin monoglutamylase TTLL4-like [Diprion similis]|uniref:tubulin monoglutamylase TTLL4-like n=1 Tax=Diprion similis TaxID=362088 RepID=UPI001EF82048|nr:tubulin monoglutamylase TTLL4-like [Diprion similis]